MEDKDDEGEGHLESVYYYSCEKVFSPAHSVERVNSYEFVDPVLNWVEEPVDSAGSACEDFCYVRGE